MKKFISLVLVLCMVITLCPVISFAASTSSITKSQLQSFIDVALQSENKSKQDLNLPNSGWCARFVAYCINNSKIVDSLGKIPSGDSAYSISPAGWIADTKSAGKLYFTSSHHYDRLKSRYNDKIISVNRNDFIPLPGDIIQFSWDGTSFSHTGIVIDFKNDQVIYIDGNSNSDGGNGTYVKKHSMNKTNGYIIGYIRFNTCGHDYDGSPYNKNGYCPDCKEWMPHTAASVDAGCYYKVKASTTAHVRNHPYHASNESIPGEYKGPIPAKTGKIQVLHAVKNGFGNIWYYIKSEKLNLEGYVLADHLEKTSSSIPATISTGGLPVPGDYTVGDLRSYIVKANLYASNCKITAISGRIISQNNGQAVSSVNKYTLPSGVDSYYTAGTSLDNGLKFGSLSAGRYYYEITAYSDSVLSNHDSGNNYAKTFVSPTFRVNERAHTHNYLLEFETAHPHKYYRKCYGCGDYAYTGDTHYTYTCVYCTGITVSFDATGGSTSIGSKTVFPGNAIGALPTPSKPNHVFDGWYTQPDGGTRYTESTVCNETSGITLYAHWIPGCTVHLDANGGRCSIDSFFVYTGNTLSSLPTPRKDKHIFEGWFSSPDGGTEFTADSICTTTGEITLYARWTPFYRIYYNGYADSQTKLHDEAIIISEPKAITGYIFKKWESSLGDTYMPGDVYEENADLTLGPDLMVWADGVLDGNPAISWSLHDGVMILSGEGKMPNFGSLPPWNNYIEDIKSVIIEDGITSIGSHAFSRAVNLESVVIADSVKNIGNYAFYECKNLTSVVLPAKLQSIGMRAFSSCFSLSSITLPSSLYNLGASAFSQCSSLTEIAIPSSVYTILESTFDLCESLKTVYLDRRLNSIASFAFADTAIEHVYFDGTESQWDNVSISSGNDKLTDASFHFSAHPGYIA